MLYISASLERLILYLNPTLVLALGAFLFHKKVTRTQILALAVSYCGVLCVFGREMSLQGRDVPLGATLVFASAVSYAIYLSYSGEEVKRLGALRLTGLATTVACLICIAQFFLLRPIASMSVPAAVIWLSVLNATLCTFAPVVMVMMAIERIGASLTAQAGTIGPLSTILMAVHPARRAVYSVDCGGDSSGFGGDLAADPGASQFRRADQPVIGTRFPGFETVPRGAKAGLIIVHGIAEHGARYRHAAEALARKKYCQLRL